MKQKVFLLAIVGFLGLVISCSNPSKDASLEEEKQFLSINFTKAIPEIKDLSMEKEDSIPEVTGTSISVLCKKGIDLTICEESKSYFEKRIGKRLSEKPKHDSCELALATTGWAGRYDFDREIMSRYLLWQGKLSNYFENSGTKKYVIIGSYCAKNPYVLSFMGDLYEY